MLLSQERRSNLTCLQIQKMIGTSNANSYQSVNAQYSACAQLTSRWMEADEK